jgi:hypothetical protein
MEKRELRLYGMALAAVIAVLAALTISVLAATLVKGLDTDVEPGFGALAVVSACMAAYVLATRIRGGLRHGIGEVLMMTLLTYLLGILIFPIGQAVVAWPRVAGGGSVPCADNLGFYCASGLSGFAALRELINATPGWYVLTPLALVVFWPLLAMLLVPSLVWVLSMRRRRARLYQRSV